MRDPADRRRVVVRGAFGSVGGADGRGTVHRPPDRGAVAPVALPDPGGDDAVRTGREVRSCADALRAETAPRPGHDTPKQRSSATLHIGGEDPTEGFAEGAVAVGVVDEDPGLAA